MGGTGVVDRFLEMQVHRDDVKLLLVLSRHVSLFGIARIGLA